MKFRSVLYLLLLAMLAGCHTSYRPASVAFKDYPVEAGVATDSSYERLLKPFRDSMEAKMGEVVGKAARRMDVKRPVTTLGNFLGDAFLTMAREKYDAGADIAVMNLGGIRKPYVEPGPITMGMVFEILPFDNTMTLVTVKGDLLKKFIETTMEEGGGVAGFGFHTDGKAVTGILIDGKPIDPNTEYTLVTSDYASNDSRMAWFYGAAVRKNHPYLLRDCIVDYIVKMGREGRPIGEQLENRIVYDK